MPEISDDAKRNREDWTQANAAYTDARASHNWAEDEITLGCLRRARVLARHASATSPASTSSSSAAAPRTSPRGSPGAARAPSAST